MRSSNFGKFNILMVVVLATTMMTSTVVNGYNGYNSYNNNNNGYSSASSYNPSTAWKSAHATFYGDETGSETMG